MRGVVAALALPTCVALVACGASKREAARTTGTGGTSGDAGAGGSAGLDAKGGSGANAAGGSDVTHDSVDCGNSQPCAVDFPCPGTGNTCVTIQGCPGSRCGDPEDLCARACGNAGCVTVPATGASPEILQCADGSHPRTTEPIEGFGDSCAALPDELERLARCKSDDDCGQVLAILSLCSSLPGPGRPPVVRTDADLTELERLLTMFTEDGCPAVRRACSCTSDDATIACVDAHCAWSPAGTCPPPSSGGTSGIGGTAGTAGSR
jgi:hypothetical protein